MANEFLSKSEKKLKQIRENYPKGTTVELIKMSGEGQMPAGLTGVVEAVDDAGQIHVRWKNGSSLALIPGVDEFSVKRVPKKVLDVTEGYIIENDKGKQYGVSFFWEKEDGYSVMMYRDRLTVPLKNAEWGPLLDVYEQETPAYVAEKLQDVAAVINAHMNFWMQKKLTQQEIQQIPVAVIDELPLVLAEGFKEKRCVFSL